jgi:hypothetical protein
MRRHARRQRAPLAFAVVLSAAAGLALAEEYIGLLPAWAEWPLARANSLGQRAGNGESGIKAGPHGTAAPQGKVEATAQRGTSPGVGSRALTGNDERPGAADQPESAPGLDLRGPPVRFPAAETPK